MKKIIWVLIFMLIFIFKFISNQVYALAETRNIYVGDIISLEISSSQISEDELRNKFEDFEIVNFNMDSKGYVLSIRTFDVGEYTILIGDKEIIINVSSTLNDITQDNIFEGENEILKSGKIIEFNILLYLMSGIFIITVCVTLSQLLRKRKDKVKSPYEVFKLNCNKLISDDSNYFVDLTYYFKCYLESILNHRIIGNTSSEIVNELMVIGMINDLVNEINVWLRDCDMFKFAGIEVTIDEKQHHLKRLYTIVDKINSKEGLT